jgi:UPF0716 family protein affecting phage T7 exclusion
VAPPVRRLLPAAFLWAPIVALYVLVGFAIGWWVPAIFAVVSAVVVGWAVVYRRRLRRLRSYPAAMRAHEERAYRRAVQWAKIGGLLVAG